MAEIICLSSGARFVHVGLQVRILRLLPHHPYQTRNLMMHWIDPACLSERRGRVSQFLLNPHGDIDGMILDG